MGVVGRFGDFIVTRFFTSKFSCVSVRFLPLLGVDTLGVVFVSNGSSSISASSSGSAVASSFPSPGTSGASGGGTSRSAAGGLSTVVDFGFGVASPTPRRFSSAPLCSACLRTLRAYTAPSSVLTRCSSVRSLLTSRTADFHLSACVGAGFQGRRASTDSQSSSNFFHNTDHSRLDRMQTAHRQAACRTNPFLQCIVSGRSVLRAVLKHCQRRTHLSLQLFLIVFRCSAALT